MALRNASPVFFEGLCASIISFQRANLFVSRLIHDRKMSAPAASATNPARRECRNPAVAGPVDVSQCIPFEPPT